MGYLKEADGEYYIPESVRYALGYNKTRRGGIKLVSFCCQISRGCGINGKLIEYKIIQATARKN